MKPIEDFADFRERLISARGEVRTLTERYPDDAMIASVSRQLEHVDAWTRDGHLPPPADLAKLSFGTMASRAIDDIDRTCAEKLYALSAYLRQARKLQELVE